jgi:hypothetical protein
MSVNCDYQVEAKLDGANWTDITPDITGVIKFSYGILGSSPLDRVGQPGEMSFNLNNTETNSAHLVGYYTPGHTNCRSGFDVGLPVRFWSKYLTVEKVKWYGEIVSDGIDVQPGRYSKRQVKVTARDWLHQASIHELVTPEFAENLAIEDIVPLILANMIKQPLATRYGVGTENFGSVFDKVKTTTHAISEFYKVAISELGFIYVTRDLTNPEILAVEGRYTRNDIVDLTVIPCQTGDGTETVTENFVDETGELFVTDTGEELVFDSYDYREPIFDNSMFELEAPFGKMLYNRIKVTSYPRKVDAAATTVLYSLSQPIKIPAGTSITFTGRYKDPAGLYDDVSGTNMKTPPTTPGEYQMFQNEDGTGTDMSADLTVTPTYGAKEVSWVLANGAASDGWVTKCDAVGKGIYASDPLDYPLEDAASILKVGPIQLNLDMKYQDDPTVAAGIAATMLEQLKTARLIPDKPSFYANRTDLLMSAFVFLEPGNRIRMLEEVTGTTSDYFINGMEATIKPGGFISFKYYLRDAGFDTYIYGKWDDAADVWDDAAHAIWAL